MTYWQTWHRGYADPSSSISQRLRTVQARIRVALDEAPPGPIRMISLCAGEGRDLLGVLADHPRREDVVGRLVEFDPEVAAVARASAAPFPAVDVLTGDAALTSNYVEQVPADLVLTCGVFGNMTDEDIRATIETHPSLCAHGATVIWTRGREIGPVDLVPQICAWFEASGFERVWLSDETAPYGVGVHRYTGEPEPLQPGLRMFTFTRGS